MIKNLSFLFLGLFGGLWIIWPEIATIKGWECARDISDTRKEKLTNYESFVEKLPSKIKLGLSLSPKALLRRDSLGVMDRIRIVGDACFR